MTFTSRISKYQRLSRLGHLEDYLEEGTVDPATLDTGLRRKLEEVQVEAGIEEVWPRRSRREWGRRRSWRRRICRRMLTSEGCRGYIRIFPKNVDPKV